MNESWEIPLLGVALILGAAAICGLCWLMESHEKRTFGDKETVIKDEHKADQKIKGFTIRQWRQFGLVLVLGLCGIFAHILMGFDPALFNSAALYVGLPFLLALGMCFVPKAKSHVGATFKGLTIAILLSFPVLNEGVICVLMASPLLYSIGLLAAWSNDRAEKKEKGSKIQLALVTSVLAIASLEGVHETTSFPRENTAEYSHVIHAPIAAIREKLAATPDIAETRPFYMQLFPLPADSEGSGLKIGDQRKLNYVYKKWIWTNEKRGSTVFRIAESTDHYIRFDIPHDDSYLASYLTWRSSEVLLTPLGPDKTKVTWRLSYTRKLDPIWYFGPLQQHYVTQTAKTLIDHVADPTL